MTLGHSRFSGKLVIQAVDEDSKYVTGNRLIFHLQLSQFMSCLLQNFESSNLRRMFNDEVGCRNGRMTQWGVRMGVWRIGMLRWEAPEAFMLLTAVIMR